MIAGAEALLFGVLVFVFGTIVAINAWSVVDARFATSAAAREAVRVAVEAPYGVDVHASAVAAGRRAFAGHGRQADAVELEAATSLDQRRCASIGYRATTRVQPLVVPVFGGLASYEVSSSHTEVIDPYRSGLPSGVDCGW